MTVDREIGRLIRKGAEFEIVERMLLDIFHNRLHATFAYDDIGGKWILDVDYGENRYRAFFHSFHEMLAELIERLEHQAKNS